MGKLRSLVVLLIVTVLLVEMGLRLLRPHSESLRTLLYSSIDQDSENLHQSLQSLMNSTIVGFRPGTMRAGYRRNSRSFRTGEYTDPKPVDGWRVMILGDSFTDASGGVPFEQMWTSELERQLRTHSRRSIEVFGLGVPGVGPKFEYRLWQLEHALVRPDLVIVALFVGNDFGTLKPWIARAPLKVSMLYRLGFNISNMWKNRRETRAVDSASPANKRSFEPEAYLEIESERFRLVLRRHRERATGLCDEMVDLLTEFRAAVTATGTPFVVMVIPDEFQVDAELLSQIESRFGLVAGDFDLDFPQKCLAERLTERRIQYLDLLPVFRYRTRQQSLYWPRNTHWNIEGNRLAGVELAGFLISQDLVPDVDPTAAGFLD